MAHKEKYYYRDKAQLIRESVISCVQCIRITDWSRPSHPPMQNPKEDIRAPKDSMNTDSVPWLPPSDGYENIVTAIEGFPNFYLPTRRLTETQKLSKVIVIIMAKHGYLRTTIISDKGPAFMSHVNKEVAVVLGFTLKHATTKHLGMLERSHGSIKLALKIETGEWRPLWQE